MVCSSNLGRGLVGVAWFLAMPAAAQDIQIIDGLPQFSVTREGSNTTLTIRRNAAPAPQLDGLRGSTAMACPPFCIQPMSVADGIVTLGELEVMDFMAGPFRSGTGVLVDARLTEWFERGTLPGAVSMPYPALSSDNSFLPDILRALGARQNGSAWDFSSAFDLLVFCNGPWSDMAAQAIESLLAAGYPASKLRYYRGGLDGWMALGLSVTEPAG